MNLKITWNNGDIEKVKMKTNPESEVRIRKCIKENFDSALIFIGEEKNEHIFIWLKHARKVEIIS